MGNGFAFHYPFLKYQLMRYSYISIFTTLFVVNNIFQYTPIYWEIYNKICNSSKTFFQIFYVKCVKNLNVRSLTLLIIFLRIFAGFGKSIRKSKIFPKQFFLFVSMSKIFLFFLMLQL